MPEEFGSALFHEFMPHIIVATTFNDQFSFGMAVFLLFSTLDLTAIFAGVRLLRIFDDKPAVADNVFVNFKVCVVFGDFMVILGAHGSIVYSFTSACLH